MYCEGVLKRAGVYEGVVQRGSDGESSVSLAAEKVKNEHHEEILVQERMDG